MTTTPFDYPADPGDDEAAFWRDTFRGTDPATDAAHTWFADTRRVALTVPCPDCNVDIGAPCVIRNPTNPADTAPLVKFPAHVRRIHNARKATA